MHCAITRCYLPRPDPTSAGSRPKCLGSWPLSFTPFPLLFPSPSLFLSLFSAPSPLTLPFLGCKKGSPYSTAERRVLELIPVLGSQPAGDVSHKPGGRLPLLSARPAENPQPLTGLLPILLLGEQRHDGCEQLRLLPDSVATAI